ncbi:MAG: hypothetical protein WD229_14845 [Pirellulales bacterium]
MVIGAQQSGVGLATVTGAGSQWTLTSGGQADVGASGIGRLEILDGGVVTTTQSGQMRIAANTSSHGTVDVDGQGSLLNMNTLSLGATPTTSGSALLRISNGAIVNSPSSQNQISPQGRVELDGGLLRTGQLTHSGVITGSGEVLVTATSNMNNNGRIEAGAGDLLRMNGSMINFQNQGIVTADGGTIEFQRAVINNPSGINSGEITLRNGLMRAGTLVTNGPQLTNSSVLAATGGLNDFYGRITNMAGGDIAVTNQSVMIFHDHVTADGGTITVFPGSSAVFLEDLTVGAGAVLLADLAGTMADTGFGQIEVIGTAQLAGALDVTLANGFTPEAGDYFPLLAAGGIGGSLSLGSVPELPANLAWNLDADAHRVVLNVVPALPGDYNVDGSVDAADFVVWRRMVGQAGNGLVADGDFSGEVDSGDYDIWLSHFGETLAGAGADGAAIPESATLASFLIGIMVLCSGRRMLH